VESVPESTTETEPQNTREHITTINLGGVQIKVKTTGHNVQEKEIKPSDENSVLQIKKTENDNRHVYVDLEKMVRKSKDATLGDLSKELMGLLQGEVLDMGAYNNDYFNAVKSMIEAAMATVSIPKSSDGHQTASGDTSNTGSNGESRQHYATEKELQEDREVRPEDGGAWVREGTEEQNLKEGEFIVENGVMYIPPGQSGKGNTQDKSSVDPTDINADVMLPKIPSVVGGQGASRGGDGANLETANDRTSDSQHIGGDHVHVDDDNNNNINSRTGESGQDPGDNRRSNSKDEL
jgi:hypothetical protein